MCSIAGLPGAPAAHEAEAELRRLVRPGLVLRVAEVAAGQAEPSTPRLQPRFARC